MDIASLMNNQSAQASQESSANNRSRFGGEDLDETFDNFLMMLTTQMQNQDPLEPMKTEEFTQQLVGFAGVEQQISSNKNLEKLIDLQGYNQMGAAVNMIGKHVEAEGDKLQLENGMALGAYNLSKAAESADIRIQDASGRIVRTIEGDTSAGRHEFVWDGLDNGGNQLPPGTYSYAIMAKDGDEVPVPSTTSTIGRVDGIETDGGKAILKIGDAEVGLSLIKKVHDIPSAPSGQG
ncbi:flagellar hook assembly protein FlgD [Fodinicurvata sediminis]|uniref:flagellar hook assembly protein FlgD n=1 Tax=Fodinicurvata sediminis TaxID=1121832 RepID=UPI0003B6B43E|nr:flagellar hook capping FlgD N-terminal domain-containing protein [Fodinicurvata sediminis]